MPCSSSATATPPEKTKPLHPKASRCRRRNKIQDPIRKTPMATHTLTSETAGPSTAVEDSPPRPGRHRMSTRNRLLFFLVAWLIVLMPFLFWWSTWFGRRLSNAQITEYLNDDKHPRHIQHALVQVGERMAQQEAGA